MPRGPIVMELNGRTGNQLCQFAASYALSLRLDAPLRFSSRAMGRCPLDLPHLVHEHYVEASPRELLRVGRVAYDVPGRRLWDRADRDLSRVRGRLTGHHRNVNLEEHGKALELLEVEAPAIIRGWLQDERLFADHADAVDAAIRLPDVDAFLPADLPRPLVAVSFRRGDFTGIGRSLPLAYYETALSMLLEHEPPGTILLVGDDLEFCELAEPWLARFGPVVNALHVSRDPIVNLAMLARADHSVIANSTYSWWGAWLAERRGDPAHPRRVFTPDVWVKGYPRETLALERWTAVPW